MRVRALAAALGAIMVSGLAAGPASGDTPRCVTRKEYKKVEKGWSKKRVKRVFDTGGKLFYDIGGTTTRKYNACGYGTVYVDYENGRVTGKDAFFF
jgi:hypothetical protein